MKSPSPPVPACGAPPRRSRVPGERPEGAGWPPGPGACGQVRSPRAGRWAVTGRRPWVPPSQFSSSAPQPHLARVPDRPPPRLRPQGSLRPVAVPLGGVGPLGRAGRLRAAASGTCPSSLISAEAGAFQPGLPVPRRLPGVPSCPLRPLRRLRSASSSSSCGCPKLGALLLPR